MGSHFPPFFFMVLGQTYGKHGNYCSDSAGVRSVGEVRFYLFLSHRAIKSIQDTPPKFNSSPLKSYRAPIGKACLPTTIFQGLCHVKLPGSTLPKTNIAPTNGWLEYYFPIGFRPIFRGDLVSFREGK